jgi:hypothetical protein
MTKVQRDKARLKKLTDEDDDFVDASPAGRLGMMWELTAEVWSLQGQDIAQQLLQRHGARLDGCGLDEDHVEGGGS